MATMKENKGKGLASAEAIQTEGGVLTQSHLGALEKRNTISKMVDTRSLPSCQGNKKLKLSTFTPSKPPIMKNNPFIPPTAYNRPSMAKTPLTDANLSLNPYAATPPKNCPLTLLRSKGITWDSFLQAVTDKNVTIFYDMSVKEFERSTVHDIFKVFSIVHNHL